MSAKTTQTGSRRDTASSQIAMLENQLAAVQQQRLSDQIRLAEITKERDLLRFERTQSVADAANGVWMPGGQHRSHAGKKQQDSIDPWLIKPAASRAQLRKEPAFDRSILTRITAHLVLRFARQAARNNHFAMAEVLYQAILFLAPRAFVWRQAGNMIAAQGHYEAAIDCFDQVIQIDQQDGEAWHARGVALQRLERIPESRESLARAFALQPDLAYRKIP
jgi:tetratricopeptide (TPR) repeat protein